MGWSPVVVLKDRAIASFGKDELQGRHLDGRSNWLTDGFRSQTVVFI